MNLNKKEWRAEWRSGKDTVGIVLVEDDIGKWRGYMGVAQGNTEKEDAQYIADWGAKLSFEETKVFFPEVTKENFSFI